MFQGGPEPASLDAADVNNDGQNDISDLTYYISWMFSGGPAPICGTIITSSPSLEFTDAELQEAQDTLQEAGFDIVLVEEEVEELNLLVKK